jgi:hypothetical protein
VRAAVWRADRALQIILLRQPVIAAGDRLAIEKQFTAAAISG